MDNNLFDLQIWIKAKELAKKLYKLTSSEKFNKDWGLRDQIRRAVISISSNIAEGCYRSGRKEFKYFLKIAKGSCGEILSQIIIAEEIGYFDINMEKIKDEIDHLSKMIGKLIGSIKT